ncbi:hypothetical protein COHA_007570 [Chlorella ohadii]|uniref:Uncharacterized protein n=1 Tax=Chlorella ohadii TaxID=2649997 RepID=A0AAD5DLT6_9CHLO|nr:hypothetical protein COHA_007570 [Chlorella ohadii]
MVFCPTAGLGASHGFWSVLLALLQIALSVAIAVVVSEVLWTWKGNFNWNPSWWSHTSANNVCLMTTGGTNLCAFTYVVIAVSLAASVFLLITQLFSRGRGRRCCGCCEGWLSLLLTCWWIAAATTGTIYGVRADNASVPEHDARTAVWAMGWSEVGLWALSAVLAFASRRAAKRRMSETELTATLSEGEKRYSRFDSGNRYGDTPFANRSSKWREARDSYKQRAEAAGVAAAKV